MAEEIAPTVEDAAGQTAATGEHTQAAEGGGLPQFEIQHWGGQIGYLLILFAITYVLMSKVFGPRIRRVFDARAEAITGALASARQVQAEAASQAEAAEKAINDARDAKSKAAAEAAERQASLEADLNAQLGKAEQRIRASRDAAMANVSTIATETAEAIVKKLTGQAPSGAQVKAALAKLEG
jgi:F-type H+-transporting ATPase subunit b